MKYICLYKHPQLPLCQIKQAANHNDTKEWVCIKAYRFDDDASKIIDRFSELLKAHLKADGIFNISQTKFIEAFDALIEANTKPPRAMFVRILALLTAMVILGVHCAIRTMLIPISIGILIIMGGGVQGVALIAVLYRATNLMKIYIKVLIFTSSN